MSSEGSAPVPTPSGGKAGFSPGGALRRRERLRGSERFDELFRAGRMARSRWFLARALSRASGDEGARLGALAGKAVGGAVQRNRVKRRIRAAFRALKAGGRVPGGRDFAVLPRPGMLEAGWEELVKDLETVLGHLAVDTPENAPPPPRSRASPRR